MSKSTPHSGRCKWCGENLAPSKGNKPRMYCDRYCSDKYRRQGEGVTPSEDMFDLRLEEKRNRHSPATCKGCGAAVAPNRSPGRPKTWCSEACRVANYRKSPGVKARKRELYIQERDKRREDRERELESNPLPTCHNCGATLRKHTDKYCNRTECRTARYHAKKSTAPRCNAEGCERPSIAKGKCGSHYSLEWKRKNPDKAQALNHRYRARKREAWVEDISRDAILERDNWTCHLCGHGIPKDLPWPHQLYPSLDHVIPLNQGGKHEAANVKAAHYICNTIKSDTVGWKADSDHLLQVADLLTSR